MQEASQIFGGHHVIPCFDSSFSDPYCRPSLIHNGYYRRQSAFPGDGAIRAKLPARTATATVTITVGDTQPPVITAPANLTAITSTPTATCAVVNFSVKASDNCGAVEVTTTSSSGTCFPLGVTTVTSTETDSAGNKATASFKVTVWDISLQDDNSGDLLLFNSYTGDYSFSKCAGGATLTGKAIVSRVDCQTTLSDAKVSAIFERCLYSPLGRGRAAIRLTPLGTLFTINDSNTADNTTVCR